MIDFHAHILPHADHGCLSTDMAEKQLILAQKAGVKTICATSHFYPHYHQISDFISRRERGMQAIQEIKEKKTRAQNEKKGKSAKKELHTISDIAVIPGAEVLLCEGLERLEGLDMLCLEGTKTLLIELPERSFSEELEETLAELCERYTVVLAHVERFMPKDAKAAIEICPRVQINAGSIAHRKNRRYALSFVEEDIVWALGSDMHLLLPEYKNLSKTVTILGTEAKKIQERTERLLRAK